MGWHESCRDLTRPDPTLALKRTSQNKLALKYAACGTAVAITQTREPYLNSVPIRTHFSQSLVDQQARHALV